MAMTMPKLLVAVDGSERSLSTVQYLTRVPAFNTMHVVLFNVFSEIPSYYWDLEREPRSVTSIAQVRAWQVQQKKELLDDMEGYRRMLREGGFADEAIDIRIHPRIRGWRATSSARPAVDTRRWCCGEGVPHVSAAWLWAAWPRSLWKNFPFCPSWWLGRRRSTTATCSQ